VRVDGAGRHCLGDLVDGLFFFYHRQKNSCGDGFVRG
jgi:hypothetical protein